MANFLKIGLVLAILNVAVASSQFSFAAPPIEIEGGIDDDFAPENPLPPEEIIELPEGYFETYVFGTIKRAQDWIERMDQFFETQIRLAERHSPLSPGDRRKLRLAASGDVKHFLDDLEVARLQFEEVKHNLHALQPVLSGLRQLRITALSGPFGEESIFAKTLQGIRRKQGEAQVERP